MFLKVLPVGELSGNCIILGCLDTKIGALIDPGGGVSEIKAEVLSAGLQIEYLLHTHAHFDHIGAAAELKQAGLGKIYLHRADEFLYQQIVEQSRMFGLSMSPPEKVDEYLSDNQTIHIGNLELTVLHTPGHSPGGCCFVLAEHSVIFCGDTLFRNSIGRTDLDGGNMETLITSVKEKLFSQAKDYRLIPGHGEETSIFYERKNNPFFAGGFFI